MAKNHLYFAVIFITYIFTIAIRYSHVPLQPDLMQYYDVNEKSIGSLMAMFYIPFVIACLGFGYLGDRYNRKIIIVTTLYGQAMAVFLSGAAGSWPIFAASKALIGISQGGLITLAPTVISDMFNEGQRTTMLGIFASGAALGAGCGVILAGTLTKIVWIGLSNTFYIFAGISGISATAYLLLVPEFERGASEKCDAKSVEVEQLKMESDAPCQERNTIWQDLKYLFANKTYMWAIIAYSATSAVSETSMIWYIELLRRLKIVKGQQETCQDDYFYLFANADSADAGRDSYMTLGGLEVCGGTNGTGGDQSYKSQWVESQKFDVDGKPVYRELWGINCNSCSASKISQTFGMISITCGMGGTLAGIAVMKFLLPRFRNAGPLTAAGGQFLAVLTTTMLMLMCRDYEMSIVWGLTAMTFLFVTSCFGILADLVSRVVLPDKRALAYSIQNLAARIMGASLPPYVAGWIIDGTMAGKVGSWKSDFCTGNGLGEVVEETCSELNVGEVDGLNFTTTFNMLEYQEIRFDAILLGFLVIPSYALVASILWLWTSKYFTADENRRLNFGMGSIKLASGSS